MGCPSMTPTGTGLGSLCYFSGQFNGYLQQMGIRREFSCKYTPEQSGEAERKNRTVVEAARAMLEEKSLPKFY